MARSNSSDSLRQEALAKTKRKRGVILLLVLSLLTLFVLIGVTFAVLANNYNQTTKIEVRKEEYGDLPEKEFDLVLGQLLYDTFARSSLRYHSLLADLYGGDATFDGPSDFNFTTGVQGSYDFDDTKVMANAAPANGPVWGNQAYAFQVRPETLQSAVHTDYGAGPLSDTLDYYSGRLLTFMDGPAANYTGRIMQYDPTATGGPQFIIELDYASHETFGAPNPGDHFTINGAPFNGAGAGYDFITYNMDAVIGDSRTYDPMSPYPGDMAALLPHFNGFDPTFGRVYMNAGTSTTPQALDTVAAGGLDESWDAVDYQNMYLAMVPPASATNGALPILPSFHRPELVNYWVEYIKREILGPAPAPGGLDPSDPVELARMYHIMAQPYGVDGDRNQTTDNPTEVNLDQLDRIYNITRGCIFRPMGWDHANFTGSNALLDGAAIRATLMAGGINEPQLSGEVAKTLFDRLINLGNARLWDVDNDNDQKPDSIWIDPGLPIVTSPDGKRYKRMVSILIKDMDGRADLNAQGNSSQVFEQPVGSGSYPYRADYQIPGAPPPGNFGLITAPTYLPRGSGFGPAEVDLLNLFGGNYTLYTNILAGRYTSNFAGDSAPGQPGVRDALGIVKHHGVPNDYVSEFSWYASPPDVWGRGGIVLDVGGQPLTVGMGSAGEVLDHPYEISLGGQPNNADSPYTLVELERLLRYHDPDAQHLPCRPLQYDRALTAGTQVLTINNPGVIGADHTARERLGWASSSLPVPGAPPPAFRRAAEAPGQSTILNTYRFRIQAGLTASGFSATELDINRVMATVVPWELRRGGKFNLNRWLGDGFDSTPMTMGAPNGDLVADDPLEAFQAGGEFAWTNTNVVPPGPPAGLPPRGPTTLAPTPFAGTLANHSNGTDVNQNGVQGEAIDNFLARQLYARHLYCLAMLYFDSTNFWATTQFPHETTLMNPVQRRQLIARRLAQWAINAVDFRDADSIMTGFEYDLNPWDGWQVDSNFGTDGSSMNPEQIADASNTIQNVTTGDRRVVWGMEYPDLQITETLAFHSRNVKDTDVAGPMDEDRSGMPPDPDLDQFRVPQGSLFVELFCARNTGARNARLPQELYDTNGLLHLGRLAPDGRPVWRLAVGSIIRNDMGANYVERHPQTFSAATPAGGDSHLESGSFDPFEVNLLPGASPNGAVGSEFRFVYFGDASGIPVAEQEVSFFNTISDPRLPPGQYAVVGPRDVTYLGSVDPTGSGMLWDTMSGVNGFSEQRIVLDPTFATTMNGVEVYDTTGAATSRDTTTGNIRPILPIIANYQTTPSTGTVAAADWGQPWTSGMNITEPLLRRNYYPEPTAPGTVPIMPPFPTQAEAGFYDHPDPTLSLNDGSGFRGTPIEGTGATDAGGRPIYDANMQASGTYEDVSSVYLQRLANPMLPYNPPPPDPAYNNTLVVNPYLTIDWCTLDVTVTAGDEDMSELVMGQPIDPDDNGDAAMGNRPDMLFRSRQKGFPQAMPPIPALPPVGHNPWSPVTANGSVFPVTGGIVAVAAGEPYFKVDLSNNRDGVFTPATDRHTFGYLNETIDQLHTTYPGEPANPFPWLAWHNRPFTNPMELLCLPSSSPSRLGMEFTPGQYTAFVTANPYDATDARSLRSPFGHLLNFFHTHPSASESLQLQRLLDFVEVPSPFAGAERWYNPTNFATAGLYRPPFNWMSRFRDPGRININTIFDDEIFYAAAGLRPIALESTFADFAQDVARSRRGFTGAILAPIDGSSAAVPTLFGNPFRPSDASDLMPNITLNGIAMRRTNHVEATFLRPDPDTADRPLLQKSDTDAVDDDWWANYRDIRRNPYFRYQALQKFGSTFTTHSNVFAVWMTIGYFEVEPNDPTGTGTVVVNAAHPDGLRLGAEIGADSGEIRRHRMFFIIDRSVPVGYSQGQKLNTDNCVLLRRMIE